jgi:hypothetical protein
MSGWRGTGLLVILLLGCGETSQHAGHEPTGGSASGGNATAGNATAGNATGASATGGHATGGSATGGKAGEATTTSDPPTAGAGSAGEAGVGGAPCAGIVPRCEPGEQACDPLLGKLGTCDACGVVTNVDQAGSDCVRLLASDKESNAVCAVLGSDRLECFPGSFMLEKTTLPPDVVEVLLPDDFLPESPIKPCLRDASHRYSCGPTGCDGRVVIGDDGEVCGLCNGAVLCESVSTEPPAVAQPLDLSLTDGYLVVLSPLGVHVSSDPPRLPSGWRGTPDRLLVDHLLHGCVLSDQGEMACWLSLQEAMKPATWKGTFKKIIPATLPLACVLTDARQLRCGDVFQDVAPAAYGDADTVDFVASASTVCSLSVAGRVKCWNVMTDEPVDVAAGW